MNKFIEENKSQIVPEWEDFYISIDYFRYILYPLKVKKNEATTTLLQFNMNVCSNEILSKAYEKDESIVNIINKFKEELTIELNKVYFFYTENMKYYYGRLNKISDQLSYVKNYQDQYSIYIKFYNKSTFNTNNNSKKEKVNDFSLQKNQLELALKELYKEVKLMKQFIEYNIKAEKLLMKKAKVYIDGLLLQDKFYYIISEIKSYSLDYITLTDYKLDILVSDIEKLFLTNFFRKYKEETKKVLSKHLESNLPVQISPLEFFLFGLFIGIFLIVVIVIISIAFRFGIDMDDDIEFNGVIPMFRGQIMICLYMWLYAFLIYLYNKYRVNYKLVLNYSSHFSDFATLLRRAAFFSTIVGFMLLYYVIIRTKTLAILESVAFIPIRMTPLIGWFFILVYFFMPFKNIFNYQGRVFIFRNIYKSITKLDVYPSNNFVMSQVGAFTGVIRDFSYSICYYYNYNSEYIDGKRSCDPIGMTIVVLSLAPPILISLLMSIKNSYYNGDLYLQSINLLRHFFSICAISMALTIKSDPDYWVIWLITAAWTAIHGFFWDVKLDWGMLQTTSENFLLRDKLSIKNKNFYYVCMLIDFILRFSWVLIISPDIVYKSMRPEFVFMILYCAEMFRRTINNYICIEYDHICLCNNFRATQVVETPFIKNENNEFELKSVELKEYNQERDKINERLHRIMQTTFLCANKLLKAKEFLKRLEYLKIGYVNTSITNKRYSNVFNLDNSHVRNTNKFSSMKLGTLKATTSNKENSKFLKSKCSTQNLVKIREINSVTNKLLESEQDSSKTINMKNDTKIITINDNNDGLESNKKNTDFVDKIDINNNNKTIIKKDNELKQSYKKSSFNNKSNTLALRKMSKSSNEYKNDKLSLFSPFYDMNLNLNNNINLQSFKTNVYKKNESENSKIPPSSIKNDNVNSPTNISFSVNLKSDHNKNNSITGSEEKYRFTKNEYFK